MCCCDTSKPIVIIDVVIMDHQMVVIMVHVGKNMIDDILLDRRSWVNAITDGLRQKLGLLPPQLTPFNLQMVNFSFSKPLGIIPNIKIKIHGMPYIITFMVMNKKSVDPTYSMLLTHPWLWDAKVIHSQGTNMVTIEGNIIVKTIFVSIYLSGNIRRPQMVVNYNFMEGVTYKEERFYWHMSQIYSPLE